MLTHINHNHVTTMAQRFDTVKDTPWETVGSPLTKGASVEQTLIEAGLDWNVIKRPAWVDITPVGSVDEKELSGGESPLQPIKVKGNYVMMREDTMELVSPFVGPRYKPIQNHAAFEVFRDFCDAGNMVMETAGSLSGGQHIWGLARIEGEYELSDGEFITGYFLLMQSHVYGSALKAMFTPIRYPGGHMIVQAVNKSGLSNRAYTMPHSRHFNEDRIAEINEVMGMAQRVLTNFVGDARTLSKTPVSDEETILYFIQQFHPTLYNKVLAKQVVLPKRIADLADWEWSNRNLKRVPEYLESFSGADMPSCRGTAWGLLQATNHFYDHEIGTNPDTRLVSAWMGPNAKKKLQALSQAKKLGKME